MADLRPWLALAFVGCADVLGIGDVPQSAAGDAGAVDASDAAPSECQCVASAPSGWTLVAFASATGETVPAGCSGAYGQTFAQGHAGLTAAPATCGCACPSPQASGTTCGPVAFSGYSGTACNSAVDDSFSTNAQACGDFVSAQGSFKASPGAPTSLGSCGTPLPSKTVPSATWATSFAACTYTGATDGGTCAAGNECVQPPSSAFAAKPCVARTGDVACPGAPYANKTVVMTGIDDTRSCTACTCGISGGSCSAAITAYLSTGCAGTPATAAANGTCTAMGDGVLSVHVDSITTTAASCTASSSTPTGAASATAPITVCCP